MAQQALNQAGAAQVLRDVRVEEFFLYYDSVVIGPNASRTDRGWFDTFADFANADRVEWFSGRSSAVGKSYSNTNFERRDIAYGIDHVAVEFICPPTAREYVEQGAEAHAIPSLFVDSLPSQLALTMEIQGVDTILEAPARRIGAGAGVTQKLADQLGIGAYYPGINGGQSNTDILHFPETVMVPASNQIAIAGKIDAPLRPLLANYDQTPGYDNFPGFPAGEFNRNPRWYVIRVVFLCRRRLQVRGGRQAP